MMNGSPSRSAWPILSARFRLARPGQRAWMTGVLLALVLACPVRSWACTLPVFRYALERWPEAQYQVCVVHDPTQAPASQAAADAWVDKIPAGANVSSVAVRVSVDAPEIEADRLLIEELRRTDALKLPRAVVVLPIESAVGGVVWSGALGDPVPASVTSSPARQEIARQLLSGTSAVWILVRSGDAAADASASAMLKAELQKLEKELVLPEQLPPDQADESSRMRSSIPFKLAFSVVEVNRDDAAEKTLIDLLAKCDELHSAPGGEDAKPASPAVYAVFGRGRAMPGLRNDRLTPEMIANVASFLTGACSCQVKELNPGMDLLMTVEWDEKLFFDAPAAVAPVAPAVDETPKHVTTRLPASPVAPGTVTPVTDSEERLLMQPVLLVSCIAVMLLAGVMWWRAR